MAAWLSGCGASLNDQAVGEFRPADQKVGGAAAVAATIDPAKASTEKVAVAPETKKVVETKMAAVTPGSTGYKIGQLDVVEVAVFKVPDLSRTVQVSDTGLINLPLAGEIPAAGRTAQEVEKDIATKLGAKYLNNPQVTVFVKEYNSQRVTVDGAVKKPGVYPMKGVTTLMQAIALAEGLHNETASSSIAIFRSSGAGKTAARFDIDEIKAGKAPDPTISPGDLIVAEASAGKTAFNNFVKVIPLFNVFVPVL